jgi:hypothetical protein
MLVLREDWSFLLLACIFYLMHSCICLELFLKVQSIRVHEFVKDMWLLFIEEIGVVY